MTQSVHKETSKLGASFTIIIHHVWKTINGIAFESISSNQNERKILLANEMMGSIPCDFYQTNQKVGLDTDKSCDEKSLNGQNLRSLITNNFTKSKDILSAIHIEQISFRESENHQTRKFSSDILNRNRCATCLVIQQTYQQEIKEIRAELQREKRKLEENEQMYWRIIEEIKKSCARNLVDMKNQMETLCDEEFHNSNHIS